MAKKRPGGENADVKTAAANADGKAVVANFPADSGSPAERRPPNNPDPPMDYIQDMMESFAAWRDDLEGFMAHLRPLDRKRLNGVGIRKLGFIGRALQLAAENPEFLPHYLTLQKFQDDNNYFLALRSTFDIIRQIQEILWNFIIEASDVLYTDALEYYAGVREAACRKAKGFSDRSLRYAQTPHINSWSFAIGKTPKLSGVAG